MICELSPTPACEHDELGAMAAVTASTRIALRSARDQRRCRSTRAFALPDDPYRGEEARSERIRRSIGAHRTHCGSIEGARDGEMRRATYRVRVTARPAPPPTTRCIWPMLTVGLDVGSTTIKATAMVGGRALAGLRAP